MNKLTNSIEIVIKAKDDKELAVINITTGADFKLTQYVRSARETLRKVKRSLLKIAIENELNDLDDKTQKNTEEDQ